MAKRQLTHRNQRRASNAPSITKESKPLESGSLLDPDLSEWDPKLLEWDNSLLQDLEPMEFDSSLLEWDSSLLKEWEPLPEWEPLKEWKEQSFNQTPVEWGNFKSKQNGNKQNK